MSATAAAVELDPLAIFAGDDPESIMLDFMQPRLAGRRRRGFHGKARRDEAGGQCRLMQHGPKIGQRRRNASPATKRAQ